jgi:ABC-2 type transport system ATP-binding protein
MKAISIKNLSKTYLGKKRTRINALKGIDLEIAPGEVFGFLGPNGAGKSTTIKIITGQIRADGGEARLFSFPVSDPGARKKMGYLPENPSFYDFMTAREYLRFVCRAFSMERSDAEKCLGEALELLRLDKDADRPIRGFSKGMVQRLGLAQALVHDPDLYILDEPMSGLDPIGRALVKDIIRTLKSRGKTVFFSTHITNDVEAVCDRVAVIVGGKLMAVDQVETILQGGLEGYFFQVVYKDGRKEDLQVSSESLRGEMVRVLEAGGRIERIEPQRKDLESFFLDLVRQEAKIA